MNLRWIGAKAKAARDIMSLAPEFSEFRDCFAGNASLLWHVPVTVRRWINDIDPDLIRYHRAMQDKDDDVIDRFVELQKQIRTADDMRRLWTLAKIEWYHYQSVPHYMLVNRLAYGQICRRSRRGLCSYSFKYKDSGLDPLTRERLERSRSIYQRVRITRGHYAKLLDAPGKDVFILVDPPYYLGDEMDHGGKLYEYDFSLADHEELRDRLLACRHRFLLTISHCSLSHRLYVADGKFRVLTRRYTYSATKELQRKNAYELIVMNY